ncbi:2-dehydropantoate 2-reductase [Pseudoalteromonas sp. SSDWG2]|uniref:2-dehydropantoate 2-reductase n=1 Tax=Pseudoalteromonas sp. SSDWG2 TaxID=3139391 RepID=UPI003BACB408
MRVAVFGAGSTGCYLSALLCLAGLDTTIICRPRIKKVIQDNGGIHITDYQGMNTTVMPNAMLTQINDDVFDVVFVTLKCHQLSAAIDDLLKMTNSESELLFMQNGLGSFDAVKAQLHERKCLAGITAFNVLQNGAHFHKGTEGEFILAHTARTEHIATALGNVSMPCQLHKDMQPIIYGKLLLNLNNAVNAIADLPIKEQLSQRVFRKVLASTMSEWLSVCNKTQCDVAQFTKVKPKWLPLILNLPNWLFTRLASAMLDIDPKARSSMWEDIQAGRKTEIEYLNGAVSSLARQVGVPTPVNDAIVQAIAELEQGKKVDIENVFSHHLGAGKGK